VCGQAVDALGEPEAAGPGERVAGDTASGAGRRLFIVARGHPELVEQLKAVLGHRPDVEVIEDRRRHSRGVVDADEAREARRRLREEG
jgi:hypothetical protein